MTYRDIIRAVEADGWQLVRTTGSHMQYRHARKQAWNRHHLGWR